MSFVNQIMNMLDAVPILTAEERAKVVADVIKRGTRRDVAITGLYRWGEKTLAKIDRSLDDTVELYKSAERGLWIGRGVLFFVSIAFLCQAYWMLANPQVKPAFLILDGCVLILLFGWMRVCVEQIKVFCAERERARTRAVEHVGRANELMELQADFEKRFRAAYAETD